MTEQTPHNDEHDSVALWFYSVRLESAAVRYRFVVDGGVCQLGVDLGGKKNKLDSVDPP